MNPITRFSLETHAGDYASWPLETGLRLDGKPTRTKLPGYNLGFQFEVGGDYLLVLDYDCPFEERYEVELLSADLSIKSRASDPRSGFAMISLAVGALEVSSANLYSGYEIIDERTVRLLGCTEPPHLRIHVRERRPFGVGPLLKLRLERAIDHAG